MNKTLLNPYRLSLLSESDVIGAVEVRPSRSRHTRHELISVPGESLESSILLIRSQKVILDRELAKLYGVSTKVLNQAVKRNPERFPPDFMFQLTRDEARELEVTEDEILRSQIVTSKQPRGKNTKYRPYAFTEHGIMMLPSVLRSERAIQANIQIMRTFARRREMLGSNAELIRRLDLLDRQHKILSEAFRQLMRPDVPKPRPIGFMARTLKK